MDVSLFDYHLPEGLIAQRPAERRDASRLLVLGRDAPPEHMQFPDIVNYINEGDLLVFNDSKVIRARLLGIKESTGAKVELFLLKRRGGARASGAEEMVFARGSAGEYVSDDSMRSDGARARGEVWEALAKPAKRLRPGDRIIFGGGAGGGFVDSPVGGADGGFNDSAHGGARRQSSVCLSCTIGEKNVDGSIAVVFDHTGADFTAMLDKLGRIPLPPYIRRDADESDVERYQTVYAAESGSVAAPTAGLHFTEELLAKIKAKGAECAFVTLHVGLGTFRPVKAERVEEHRMHPEEYHISKAAADAVNRAKREGRRVVCVGTTAVRTLESAMESGGLPAGDGQTDIFIYPGYRFKAADALLTNFHLPKSTLLMLVSAFAGRERILAAYTEAVNESYRFFSYGDAMFIDGNLYKVSDQRFLRYEVYSRV
jgi:S-adenosylmethionine:tRNA ribosyltransferase-isomerase